MKKCKKIKLWSHIFLILIIISFTACSKENKKNTGKKEKTSSEKYVEEEKRVNPLGISTSIYEKCEKDQFLDEAGNVKYLASLLYESELGNQKGYVDITIHEYNDSKMLIDYIYGSDQNFIEGTGIERHFELYEKNTGKLLKELVVETDEAYAEIKVNCISVESTKNGVFTATTYDFSLNEISKFTCDDEGAKVTSDGTRMYYANKHRICMFDSQTNTCKTFDSNNEFITYGIMNVLTDKQGHDYVMASGMAADYNTYNFIFDTYNCEIVYVTEQATSCEMFNGLAVSYQFSENWEYTSWIVGVSDNKAFYYDTTSEMKEKNETDETVQLVVLDNGDLLFSYSDGDKVYVDVFEPDTGKRKASTVLDVASIRRKPIKESSSEDIEYYTDSMWVISKSFYSSDNVMILILGDFHGTEYYLQWQMEDSVDNNMITVSDYKIGTGMSVDISKFDKVLLLPGELSDEFKPLKEQADRLEKEYDIEINIGEECADICESYLIYPMLDYDETKNALDELEKALKKYPDNFFSQFKYEGVDGIDIHFAVEILGTNDETLGVAGGLKCIENGMLKLILDIDDVGVFDTTFHHELCHAIDEVIWYNQAYDENAVFSEEEWRKLNPYEDMYSLTYVEWGKEEYWHYSYDNEISEPGFKGGIKNAYFVDTYAMTFPTEDRARLFENLMREEGRYIDFENSPNLLKKINYYAECIRATFDTTGWEDVPWEAYKDYVTQ